MALSFACPSCRAELRLPDEAAGQSGQCPRCQVVMRIPSASQPRAVVVDPSTGAPVQPPAASPPVPAPPLDRAQPSRRQPRPVPPKTPTGPIWPTAVGIAGGLICLGLLCASVMTLFSVRATESKRPKLLGDARRGQLEGRQAVLENGVFEVHTNLAATDPFDLEQINCRCKRYEIVFFANRTYLIEQDSPHFDCILRVESQNRQAMHSRGRRKARVDFTPKNTELYVIHATSDQPALGPMTVTIREFKERRMLPD